MLYRKWLQFGLLRAATQLDSLQKEVADVAAIEDSAERHSALKDVGKRTAQLNKRLDNLLPDSFSMETFSGMGLIIAGAIIGLAGLQAAALVLFASAIGVPLAIAAGGTRREGIYNDMSREVSAVRSDAQGLQNRISQLRNRISPQEVDGFGRKLTLTERLKVAFASKAMRPAKTKAAAPAIQPKISR